MPVAFRLSKKFSDTFGDDLADEFVNWFNQVDTTYRTELSELNDRNFAKLDARIAQTEARLDARLSATEARFDRRLSTFETQMSERMSGFETQMSERMSAFETQMSERMARFEVKMELRMSALESKVEEQLGGIRTEMADFKSELIKWMFLFWLGTVGSTVAIVSLMM